VARTIALRLLQGVVVVYVVVTLTYVTLQLAPGDPFRRTMDQQRVSLEDRARWLAERGLDDPIPVQYGRYLLGLARGDLGRSFVDSRPVRDILLEAIPNTLLLAVAALIVDFTVGIGIGVVQGTRPGSRRDDALSIVTLTLYSMPVFWLGIILVMFVALPIDWIPTGGARDPILFGRQSLLDVVIDRLRHLLLPGLTLGLVGAASTARYQRAALLDALHQDYVRAARARGLRERAVVLRHALRTSLLPVIALFGMSLPLLLSGAVLVEQVFGWHGMGWVAVDAIAKRDYQVVTGAAILAAVMVVVGNLVADLLTQIADPRTREAS
jgi:peptide/nickel transport system permease protein